MNDKFNFVPFEDIGCKYGNYTISVGAYGGYGLNSGFYKREGINEYSHVVLNYDEQRKAVGFKFVKDTKTKGACKITHNKNRNSGSIVIRSFFTANSLDPKEYKGKYEPKEYEDPKTGKLFYIILKRVNEKRN